MEQKRDYFIIKDMLSKSANDEIYYVDYMPSTIEDSFIFMVKTMSFDSDGEFTYSYYYDKSSKQYQVSKSDMFDPENFNKLHNHNYFEMVFILEGEMDVRIESGKYHYNKGEGYLLNRNTRHVELLYGSWKTIYLCFRKECLLDWPRQLVDLVTCNKSIFNFFSRNFEEEIKNNKDYIDFHLQHNIEESFPAKVILDQIYYEISERNSGFQLVVYGLVARFFALLNNPKEYETKYIDLGSDSERSVAETAKRYIDDHKKRITRQQLAEILHYNGDYINRIFKKYTGESMRTYCQKVYMKEAIRLLLETDTTIIEIAVLLGFENRTQFYKIFKEYYTVTPHEYRTAGVNTLN